jgi:hypothetical protein
MSLANFGSVINVTDYLQNEYSYGKITNVNVKENEVEITLTHPTSSRTYETLTFRLTAWQLENDWCGSSLDEFIDNYLVSNY